MDSPGCLTTLSGFPTWRTLGYVAALSSVPLWPGPSCFPWALAVRLACPAVPSHVAQGAVLPAFQPAGCWVTPDLPGLERTGPQGPRAQLASQCLSYPGSPPVGVPGVTQLPSSLCVLLLWLLHVWGSPAARWIPAEAAQTGVLGALPGPHLTFRISRGLCCVHSWSAVAWGRGTQRTT